MKEEKKEEKKTPEKVVQESCPGPNSEMTGKADACKGCPYVAECMASVQYKDSPEFMKIGKAMKGIKHIMLILSGKGGVGKSTLATQIALLLSKDPNLNIGILDIDLCGPSIPVMLNCKEQNVTSTMKGKWKPVVVTPNLSVLSIQFLLSDPSQPVIWRGPRKTGLIKEFLGKVKWGTLDYLVIDCPPGTSDEHISVLQFLAGGNTGTGCSIDGLIVTTPQEVSMSDVRKEIGFCKKTNLNIIGVIENMSYFTCPHCQKMTEIFAPTISGGGTKLCSEMSLNFLGKIPIDSDLMTCCDKGLNFVKENPETEAAKSLIEIVNKIKLNYTSI